MDGFSVMPLIEAAPLGDYFITVTGNKGVIAYEHLAAMKDKAILANAGHFDVEIDKNALEKLSSSITPGKPNITEYHLTDGRTLYLLGEGRLVNLSAGDGHPAEIMDLTFGLQTLSLVHLLHNPNLAAAVYSVPKEIDQRVALLKLKALSIKIDKLTPEQEAYLNSWQV